MFSPRLKSLASLPHNSVPIDCLGPNISQGCTDHFSRDTVSARLLCTESMQMLPSTASFCKDSFGLPAISTAHGSLGLLFIMQRCSKLIITPDGTNIYHKKIKHNLMRNSNKLGHYTQIDYWRYLESLLLFKDAKGIVSITPHY